MEPTIRYVRAAGNVVHRQIVLDGVVYSPESCNLDDATLSSVTEEYAEAAKRHCKRCFVPATEQAVIALG